MLRTGDDCVEAIREIEVFSVPGHEEACDDGLRCCWTRSCGSTGVISSSNWRCILAGLSASIMYLQARCLQHNAYAVFVGCLELWQEVHNDPDNQRDLRFCEPTDMDIKRGGSLSVPRFGLEAKSTSVESVRIGL